MSETPESPSKRDPKDLEPASDKQGALPTTNEMINFLKSSYTLEQLNKMKARDVVELFRGVFDDSNKNRAGSALQAARIRRTELGDTTREQRAALSALQQKLTERLAARRSRSKKQ